MKVIILCVLALLAASFAATNQRLASIVKYVNNSPRALWKAAPNHFSTWTEEELKMLTGTFIPSQYKHLNFAANPPVTTEAADIPERFDWRNVSSKCVHPIREQLHCGSCWAFAGTGVLSDRFCIATNGTVNKVLSPQDLVSCDKEDGACSGGNPPIAWKYMVKTGVVDEDCMPYSSGQGEVEECPATCKDGTPFQQRKYYTKEFRKIGSFVDPVKAIQTEIMTNGPVEATFIVYEDFATYSSGIYHYTSGKPMAGHAVRVIGWGEENGVKFWTAANSWSERWGEKGYFRIKRGNNECGFESNVYAGTADLSRLPKLE